MRQLRAFTAVYETGSVSAAAEQLALTQPAVTVLLRELEDRLGLKLFDRSTRALRRTDAAAEAVVHAQRALGELESMATRMGELAQGGRGRVRVAATATVAQTVLPAALRAFLQRHPQVKVQVEEVAPDAFVEALLAERVDFGVGTLEAAAPGLEEAVFLRDPLVAAAQPAIGLPVGGSLGWRRLARFPLIAVKPGYGVRRRIDEAAAAAGVSLPIEHEVSLLTTALAMAQAGLGAALVPASLARHQAGAGLVTCRLVRPAVERPMAIVTRRGRSLSPAAQALADTVAAGA
ncbi:LysR family transcriptional regulator [Ramlibacter rhizophilus]|uniref:LysR family transcriptional regulator n=1 Tax=Ramlibacter rhizophilus TaxID=1781167 RepID=UPI001F0DB72E|nr:LysR family transcriptional regulator [Ramlibacter rhizophilus]